jgi:nucleoside-diphosphate-sugar epimerase
MANELAENAPLSVFITGATSALGREVTRRLKTAGHRITGATTGYENAALVRADGGIPAYPDLLRTGELRSAIQGAKADVVINLAPQLANHLPQHRADWNPRLLDEGVSALLDAAQSAGVQFVVHTSYVFADESADEIADLLRAVKSGEQKALNGTIPGCVLRFGFLYGAEVPELMSVRNLLLNGRSVDSGPSDIHACWVNVPDAARAVVMAVEQRPAGKTLNIIEDEQASPAEFIKYFAESQGFSAPGRAPRFTPWAAPSKEQAALMSLSPHVTNADAKATLGWSPRFADFRQGIDDVLLSWRTVSEVAG